MRLLAFSDLHTDLGQAQRLAESSAQVDVVVGVGDFASVHSGLEETIEALGAIEAPVVLVPGNNETEEALREACADWSRAVVLHGERDCGRRRSLLRPRRGRTRDPVGLELRPHRGGGRRDAGGMSQGCVLAVHSPPRGHVDVGGAGKHLGSEAVLRAIESKRPRLALCGHVHESWGRESEIGPTRVINLGPEGMMLEL